MSSRDLESAYNGLHRRGAGDSPVHPVLSGLPAGHRGTLMQAWHLRYYTRTAPLGLTAIAALVLFCATASAAITKAPEPIPDLKPPREAPLPPAAEQKKTDILPWFLGAGAIAILAAVIASWPRKLPPAPTPPYTIARKELELLNAKTTSPATVSSIVRTYLIDAFRIPARGATASEILDWLAAHPRWDMSFADEVTTFFAVCDATKFSPIPPTEHPAMVEQARSLIAKIEGRRASGGQPVPEAQAS